MSPCTWNGGLLQIKSTKTCFPLFSRITFCQTRVTLIWWFAERLDRRKGDGGRMGCVSVGGQLPRFLCDDRDRLAGTLDARATKLVSRSIWFPVICRFSPNRIRMAFFLGAESCEHIDRPLHHSYQKPFPIPIMSEKNGIFERSYHLFWMVKW